MMKAGIILGASAAALAAMAACSSFDSADAPGGSGADGGFLPDGAPAPLTGVASADLQLAFDTPAMVMHGSDIRVPFTIVRGNQYHGVVVIAATGLPPTITSTSASLQGIDSSGEIVLTLSKGLPQGALDGVTIIADGQDGAKPHASMAFAPFVRGTPGEIDTTFATNGVLNAGPSSLGSQFDVDAQGRIVVMNDNSLRRFMPDGKSEDPAFHPASLPMQRSLHLTHQGDSIFVGRTGFDSMISATYATKFAADGTSLLAYGSGAILAGPREACAMNFSADGSLFVAVPDTAYNRTLTWTYSGAGAEVVDEGTVASLHFTRSVVGLNNNSAVLAGDNVLAKVGADGSTLDSGFGTSGIAQLPSALKINDMITDATGRYLVTGQLTSGPLYLARLTPQGKIDSTFGASNSPYTAKAEAFTFTEWKFGTIEQTVNLAGRLTLDANANILQAGQVDDAGVTKCAVVRYGADGLLDQTFGNNGVTKLDPAGCYAHRVLVQPDGRILVGGPVVVRVWN